MPTDDKLTTLLRRGFARATADLDPKPDLIQVIHRRHVSARRRRVAVAVAVPAAVLATGAGLVLAGQNTSNHAPGRAPSHAAVAAAPPAAPAPRGSAPKTTHRSVPVTPASYRVDPLVLRRHHNAPLNCPANATAPVGKSANPSGVWFWTHGQCVFVGVEFAHTKPANATPVHIKGYPGLYGTLENGVRTIYAPAASVGWSGGWVALSMNAGTSQEQVVHWILIPAN